MKLCRFVLNQDPETVRSGIFHENRIYETVDLKPVGIYDLGKIRLLPPVGAPPTIRVFNQLHDQIHYHYLNPTGICGPLAQYAIPSLVKEFAMQIRVAAITHGDGLDLSLADAGERVLGYTVLVNFVSLHPGIQQDFGASKDFHSVAGPFIVTPEDIESTAIGDPSLCQFQWKVQVQHNGNVIYQNEEIQKKGFAELIQNCTKHVSLANGDVIGSLPFNVPHLNETSVGRDLLPGDKIQVEIESLGILTFNLV